MMTRLAAAWLLAAAFPAAAATLTCPDLATAVRAGACPSEEELQYTFIGYCSDNARAYETDDTCTDYRHYRKLKNVALWEAGDGAFQGYLSCELPEATIRAARAGAIAVARQGRITRVVCSYTDGITLTHRTPAACRVAGDGRCTGRPQDCRAECD